MIPTSRLIEVLEHEAQFRAQSGSTPAKRDTDFIHQTSHLVAALTANPDDGGAREAARALAKKIQNNPLKGQKLD